MIVTAESRRPAPRDFIWGVATAAFQIEGASKEDGRGPSIWDTFCEAGRVANHDTGEVATDHYHRFPEDIALMRELGVNAYRFSVAWPRILPFGRGAANEPGLAFYDRLIDALLEAGIEPWLCLYHWDLPQALADRGGWLSRDCAGWFADYATVVARRYGDRVKRWVTINEPAVFTLFGYGIGDAAPAVAGPSPLRRATHTVNLAHGAAVDVVRSFVPDARVGCVHNRQPCHAASASEADIRAAAAFSAHWNDAFPDPQCLGSYPASLADAMEPFVKAGDMAQICRPVDFIGINHYSPLYCRADPHSPLGYGFGAAPEGTPMTPIGWPIAPAAFTSTLVETSQRYRLPIYVTENGLGAHDKVDASGKVNDRERLAYLDAYVAAMHDAIAAGADVRGYFVWSLIDNFEWGAGYASRFGLVHIDYETLKRTPKKSFYWYADTIRAAKG